MQRTPLLRSATAWGLLVISANLLPGAEFVPLGFDVTRQWIYECINVSEDGSVVVGAKRGELYRGKLYRWSRDQGAEVLLEDYNINFASMSGDGSIIISSRGALGDDLRAFKVTENGVEFFPIPFGYEYSYNPWVSQDGSTVYLNLTTSNRNSDGTRDHALIRWTAEDVTMLAEWLQPIDESSSVRGVSATGDVVVGDSPPFRWTEETGFEALPLLTPDSDADTLGVSSDGRWTVGRTRTEETEGVCGFIPVRWDGLSPPETLSFDGNRWNRCSATDVSLDGSRIIGSCDRCVGGGIVEARAATLWTQETGMISLQDLLVSDYGLSEELDGWKLEFVFDITDDGRFLVGGATNPQGSGEAFLVDLSPNLPGDFNADGQLNTIDIDELSSVVREGTHTSRFDLTDDDLVTDDDRIFWVHQLKNTYFGDANLDGEFNTGDLTHVLEAGKYETGQAAGWDEGDWNGDAIFGTGDFVTALIDGGYELGPKQNVAPVPEPTSTLLFMMGLIGLTACQRRPQN